jgi:beta-propeller uncharacterized protein DUF5122
MSKKALLAALAAAVVATLATPVAANAATPPALNYTPVSGWWGTNGRVMDIVSLGGRVYLAGGFDTIGPQTGYGVAVDGANGTMLPGAPVVNGIVYASAPDGAGGWYIGGSFTQVGGKARKNAAHLTAAGVLDTKWNPKPNNTVYAMTKNSTEVVLGGAFTQIGATAVAANRIGAVDLTKGTAVPGFTASADNIVRALLASGSSVYAGGDFGSINGSARSRLARIAASNGAVDGGFLGSTNATVRALALSSDGLSVYAGGDFTVASGATRNRLAAWSTSGGALTAWSPSADASVGALAVDPTAGTVYAGGLFANAAGAARTALVAIDGNGAATSFDAGLNGCQTKHIIDNAHSNPPCSVEVSSLTASNGTLYVGGRFGNTGTTSRHDAAAFTLGTGALTSWNPVASDRVLTLTGNNGNLFVGGELTSVNGLVRKGLAALDATTGVGVSAFTADADDEVLDITPSPDGSTLYMAGHFATVNGADRRHLAAVSTSTGAVQAFKAQTNDDVFNVAYAGGALFVTGQFARVNSSDRNHAAKLNPLTGDVDPTFIANTTGPSGPLRSDGMVQSMVTSPDGSKVFLGGPFNTVNGTSVTGGVVAVSGTTGALLARFGAVEGCGSVGPWIVHLAISPDGQRLYGGDVCPDRIYQWDAVNMTTAQNPTGLKWKGWCNGGMQGAMEVNGNFYYGSHGGDKGSGGRCWASPTNHTSVTQSRYAVFDSITGALRPDKPQFDSPMGVWSFATVPQGLLVGGDFAWAVSRNNVRQGLVLFAGTP